MYEEVGVKIGDTQLVECADDFYLSKKDKVLHSILLFYVVDNFTGEPSVDNLVESEVQYITGFEWVKIDEIKNIKWYNPMDNNKLVQKALEVIVKIK